MPIKYTGKTPAQLAAAFTKLQRNLPKIIGIEAVNHFKQSFRDGGFTDYHLEKWKERKKAIDSGRGILVKTGALRKSIRVLRITNTSVTVGVDGNIIPYAEIHNEGGTAHRRAFSYKRGRRMVYVKAHGAKYPKRQFIGNSIELNRKIKRRVILEMNRFFKGTQI